MTEDQAPYNADQPDQGFRVYSRIELPTTTVLNSILKRYGPMMGAYGKAIYLDLCMAASTNRVCWLTNKELAESSNISVSTVIRTLRDLVDLGLLIKKHNKIANNRNAPNTYILIDPEVGIASRTIPPLGPIQDNALESPGNTIGGGCPTDTHPPACPTDTQVVSQQTPRRVSQGQGNNVVKDVVTNKNNNVVTTLDDLFKRVTAVYDKYPRNIFEEQYNVSLELCGADEYRALVYMTDKIQVLLERDPRKVRSAPALVMSAIQRNWTPNSQLSISRGQVDPREEEGVVESPSPIGDVPAAVKTPETAQEEDFRTWDRETVLRSFDNFVNMFGFEKALRYVDEVICKNPHWPEIRKEILERRERGEY